MKPHSSVFLAFHAALLLAAMPARGAERTGDLVYSIPINGMIERGLVYVVRRAVARAMAEGADAIIFDMDTPGGRLDAAEEIINIISAVETTTYTYVNPNAISAGAIIAMATDHIYMAPGSRIGDAMPIMMTPFGSPQEMPGSVEEKAISYVAGLIRSTAEEKGHDPKLAEAMVRPEIEYKIGDEVISPADQLLTLTNKEAERIVERDGEEAPLLSSGTVEDIGELLRKIGKEGAEVREVSVSLAEQIARFIEMFSALFLIGGLLGIYIEFKTPGFGLPGTLGIILLAIWFWGHHVAGLAGMGEILIFLIGIVLLGVEIFLIPGFGVAGLAGITMMAVALLMAMVEHYPGMPWYEPPVSHIQRAVMVLGSSLATFFAAAIILARFLPETPLFQRLVLASSVSAARGFQASEKTDRLLGLSGVAATALRPAGIGSFGDQRLDVVTRGEFVEKGARIIVAETHGNRIIVEQVG